MDKIIMSSVWFLSSGFNLQTWLSTKGYIEPLTWDQTYSLMRELGMDQFVELKCDRNETFYQPETLPGWKIEPGNISQHPVNLFSFLFFSKTLSYNIFFHLFLSQNA